MKLTTDRLTLRPLCEDDGDSLHAAFSDPETLHHWHMPPTASVEESRERTRTHCGPGVFAICENGSDDALGFVGFAGEPQPSRQSAFGYLLRKEHWGKGYVAEAGHAVIGYGFEHLGVAAAELWIYDGNDQSRRVAEKLGGRYRGFFAGFNLLRGVRVTHVYEILRPGARLAPEVVRVTPLLRVADVVEAVAWYRSTLGFMLEWAVGDPPVTAALIAPGWMPNAATIRVQSGESVPSRLAFAVPERIDELAAAAGVAVEDRPWGMRDFTVTDPWGNTLTFETPTASS